NDPEAAVCSVAQVTEKTRVDNSPGEELVHIITGYEVLERIEDHKRRLEVRDQLQKRRLRSPVPEEELAVDVDEEVASERRESCASIGTLRRSFWVGFEVSSWLSTLRREHGVEALHEVRGVIFSDDVEHSPAALLAWIDGVGVQEVAPDGRTHGEVDGEPR